MDVLMTGSGGLVGSALRAALAAGGHRVVRLVRSPSGEGQAHWDPDAGTVDLSALSGCDAAIHLAGESLNGRWTPERKRRIRESRERGTRALADALARLERPPGVLVSASAVGYYGDCGDEVLTEESPPGSGFLANVCRVWEAATQPAAAAGIRVVNLRFGVILSREGGALAEMLPAFRLGVGGRLGSGRQWMSWVALEDVVGIIAHALSVETLRGAANAVAPDPVTNAEFTRLLGRVLGRPTLFRVPPFALRLALGELADAALLASVRAVPARLLAEGYAFRYPKLEGALRHVLDREL